MTVETHIYTVRSGRPLHADVHRSAASGPVIVWIHGGALIFGDRSHVVLPAGKLLARYLDAGCTVVSIDYRLAPETPLAGIVDDVTEACDWTRGRFGDDLVVAGQSAGGYLALMAGVRVRPRAVAALYGYGDIVGPGTPSRTTPSSPPSQKIRLARPSATRRSAARSTSGADRTGAGRRRCRATTRSPRRIGSARTVRCGR